MADFSRPGLQLVRLMLSIVEVNPKGALHIHSSTKNSQTASHPGGSLKTGALVATVTTLLVLMILLLLYFALDSALPEVGYQ